MAAKKAKPKVLVIAGSTSVGKTELSLELASILNGEILSADSAQVFKGFDIGSAKITPQETRGIPHHLLDIASIDQLFSAGQFAERALLVIDEVQSRGKVPMLVGGTGLYIRSVMNGPSGAPQSTTHTRAGVDEIIQRDGSVWEVCLERLRALDPVYADSLETNDWFRLKRGLEICTISGRSVTSFKKDYTPEDSCYDYKCLFLTMPRITLKQRIDYRCEVIVQQGLFKEVIRLCGCGLVADSQAGRSVGYRQALEFLEKAWGFPNNGPPFSLQVPREQLTACFMDFLYNYQSKTRQLATNQATWFKRLPYFHWLNVAPGGERVPSHALATAVCDWFVHAKPLPEAWSGEELKSTTKEEVEQLKRYDSEHRLLRIFNKQTQVDRVLNEIESDITNIT